MASNSIIRPYDLYIDRAGNPLEAGQIYIGIANSDPEVAGNTLQVYYDRGLTSAAAQPIRTTGGSPSFIGTPAKLFVDADDYSITVKDKNGALIYTSLTNLADAPLVGDITPYWQFETVAKMVLGQASDGTTVDFSTVPATGWLETKWYQTAQKTGGARYEVIPIGSYSGTPDQKCDHTLLGGLYVAKLIINGPLKVTTCGVVDNDNTIDYGIHLVAMLALLEKHGVGGTIDLEDITIFKDTTVDIPRDIGLISSAGSSVEAKTPDTGAGFRFTSTGTGFTAGDRPEIVLGNVEGFDIALVVSASSVVIKVGRVVGYTLAILFEAGATTSNVQALQLFSSNDTAVKVDSSVSTVSNITVSSDYVFAQATALYIETGGGNFDAGCFHFGTVLTVSGTMLKFESQSASAALYLSLRANKFTGLTLMSIIGSTGTLQYSDVSVNYWSGGANGLACYIAPLMLMNSTSVKVNNLQNPVTHSWLQAGPATQCEFDFLFPARVYSVLIDPASLSATNRYIFRDIDFSEAPAGAGTDLQNAQINWANSGALASQHKHVRYVFPAPLTTDLLTLYMTHQLVFEGQSRFRVTNLESIVDGGTFLATINHAEAKSLFPSTYGMALEIVFKFDKNINFIVGDEIIFTLEVVQ